MCWLSMSQHVTDFFHSLVIEGFISLGFSVIQCTVKPGASSDRDESTFPTIHIVSVFKHRVLTTRYTSE